MTTARIVFQASKHSPLRKWAGGDERTLGRRVNATAFLPSASLPATVEARARRQRYSARGRGFRGMRAVAYMPCSTQEHLPSRHGGGEGRKVRSCGISEGVTHLTTRLFSTSSKAVLSDQPKSL